MRETGSVYKLTRNGSRAKIRFPRRTACENCNMCLKPKNEMYVEVTCDNVLKANVGDRVAVEMGEKYVLTAAFIVYLIPIILVTVALFAFSPLGEWWQLGASAFMLLAGVGISVFADRKLRKRKGFCPQMVEIMGEDLPALGLNADNDNETEDVDAEAEDAEGEDDEQ